MNLNPIRPNTDPKPKIIRSLDPKPDSNILRPTQNPWGWVLAQPYLMLVL